MSAAAAASRLLPIPGSPRNTTPGVVNVPASPTLFQTRQLAVAAHQRTPPDPRGLSPFADYLVVGHQPVNALHGGGFVGRKLELVAHQ